MPNVTISQKEYERLLDAKLKYDYLRQLLDSDLFAPPQIKNSKSIISEFRKTGLYNEKFLRSLAKGLKRSPPFTEK